MTWLMEILKICLEEHSDKMLCDKAFKIAKIPKYDGCLIQCFINFLIKKTSGSGVKSEIISNQELATELQKPVIRKFENRKVQSSFMDKIKFDKFNKGFRSLLCIF